MPIDLSPAEFVLVWDIFTPLVADMMPERPDPATLSDPVAGVYSGLELNSHKVGAGVLVATSLNDGRIDGYVVFFDPDGFAAIQAVALVSLSLGEPEILEAVMETVYQGEPSQTSDVPISFDGVNHRIELLRTGADPVEDPLWILTAVPTGSSVDHDRLRLAGAEAARATF